METLLSKEKTPQTEPVRSTVLDREKILSQKRYWRLRRTQDVILSLLALIVLFPILFVISIVICIDSPGAGPLYSQYRVGRDGKLFRLYKLRSMEPNADEKQAELMQFNDYGDSPAFKMKEDPRITRVGRFIRKTSIDELPQLWNVLKGDMSIVGPRPVVPEEAEQQDDFQKQRLYVTPGLTCYWQIQPNRNDVDYDERMAMDLKYIEDRSFLTDWKIIFKTFGAILAMNGE